MNPPGLVKLNRKIFNSYMHLLRGGIQLSRTRHLVPTTHLIHMLKMRFLVSIDNTSDQQHGISTSSISYSNSDLADPDLWDGNFNPISIFGIIKKSG